MPGGGMPVDAYLEVDGHPSTRFNELIAEELARAVLRTPGS